MEFTTDHWCDRYDSHLQALKTLKQKSPNWTLAMQKRMYEAAWLVFHFLCVHSLLEFFKVSMQRLPERSPKSQPLMWTTYFAALERSVN